MFSSIFYSPFIFKYVIIWKSNILGACCTFVIVWVKFISRDSFGAVVAFVYTRDLFGPTGFQQQLGKAREVSVRVHERAWLSCRFPVGVTMAEPSKRQRLSHINSSSQTSSKSLPSIFTDSQDEGLEGEGRFVEGSILRITMKNFL